MSAPGIPRNALLIFFSGRGGCSPPETHPPLSYTPFGLRCMCSKAKQLTELSESGMRSGSCWLLGKRDVMALYPLAPFPLCSKSSENLGFGKVFQ